MSWQTKTSNWIYWVKKSKHDIGRSLSISLTQKRQDDAPLTDSWKPKPPKQLAASTAKVNKKNPRVNNQTNTRNVTYVDNADMVNVPHQPPAKQPAQRTGKLMVTVVGQTISTLSVSTKRKRNTTRLTTHLTRRVPHLIHYAPQQP